MLEFCFASQARIVCCLFDQCFYPLRPLLISIIVLLVLRVLRGAWPSPLSSLRAEAFGLLSGAKDSRHFWNPQIRSKARTRYSKQTSARATSIGAAGSSYVRLVPAFSVTSSECHINCVSVCPAVTSLLVKTLVSHVFTSVLMTLLYVVTVLQVLDKKNVSFLYAR